MVLLSFLLGAAVIYLLQDILYQKFWNRNLELAVNLSANAAFEGDTLELTEMITNRKVMPLPVVKVRFAADASLYFIDQENASVSDQYYRTDLMSVMMYQRLTRRLNFICTKRGFYTFSELSIAGSNLFLAQEYITEFPDYPTLYVYPKQVDSEKLVPVFKKLSGEVLCKRHMIEDPFEFRAVREYQQYDSMNTVNWNASAKTGELKVNANDYTVTRQMHIFLDLEDTTLRKQDALGEEAIRIAAAIAGRMLDLGVSLCISTNAKESGNPEVLTLSSGSGRNHHRSALEMMARIDMKQSMPAFLPLYREKMIQAAKQEYCVVISYYQREDLQETILEMKQDGAELLWVVPFNSEVLYQVEGELRNIAYPWEVKDES